MRLRRAIILCVALVASASTFVACSGGSDDDDTTSIDLSFDIENECLHPGDRQTIRTTAIGGANIAYAVQYADGVTRGEPPRGDADGAGKFEASWRIPDDAPAGTVRVTILAARMKRTGTTQASFDVMQKETPCP